MVEVERAKETGLKPTPIQRSRKILGGHKIADSAACFHDLSLAFERIREDTMRYSFTKSIDFKSYKPVFARD
jgi:hypothetical protein